VIIRVQKRDHPFVIIDKSALEDRRLSFRAKGLHAYLLSRPDNWVPNREHLATVSTEGIFAVRTVLKELEDAGYITREKERDQHGHFEHVTTVYETCKSPLVDDPPAVDPPVDGIIINKERKIRKKKEKTIVSQTSEKLLVYLNDILNREGVERFRSATPLPARLHEGLTEQDAKLIVEYKHAEWSGTDYEKYIRPSTLFGVEKCPMYLALAKKWNAQGRPVLRKKTPAEQLQEGMEAAQAYAGGV